MPGVSFLPTLVTPWDQVLILASPRVLVVQECRIINRKRSFVLAPQLFSSYQNACLKASLLWVPKSDVIQGPERMVHCKAIAVFRQ